MRMQHEAHTTFSFEITWIIWCEAKRPQQENAIGRCNVEENMLQIQEDGKEKGAL